MKKKKKDQVKRLKTVVIGTGAGVVMMILASILMLMRWRANNKEIAVEQKQVQTNENEAIKGAVVRVECENPATGGSNSGSGTIIRRSGLVLTSAHLIPYDDKGLITPNYGCKVVVADSATGEPQTEYLAKPIVYRDVSATYDLAFLEIENSADDELPSIENECKNFTPKLGEQIRVYGYPMITRNQNLTVTEGMVSNFEDKGRILTSAKMDYGNSGGLAVDSQNCVVGVPSAVLSLEEEGKTIQSFGVILPMEQVYAFLSEVVVAQKLADAP